MHERMMTIVLFFVLGTITGTAYAVTVQELRCEYLKAPLGIDVVKPRLSWIIVSDRRGQKQTAYQLLVASSAELLARDMGDLWDSGRVASDRSIHVEYGGKPLTSRMCCHWKVRVWDENGHPSDWSRPAPWTMGLLVPEDWKSQWIGLDREDPSMSAFLKSLPIRQAKWIWSRESENPLQSAPVGKRFFRRLIELPRDRHITQARIQIAADNEFTLWINGHETGQGDDHKVPNTFDVGKVLKSGINVLAVEAANAHNRPNPAGLIASLVVDFDTGEPLQVSTDAEWRASHAPVEKWRTPAFDDRDWEKVMVLGDYGIAPWGRVGGKYKLPARYLRKEFHVDKQVKRATAYVCGLGFFDLFLNGEKVGDHVMDPAFTYFSKRVMYVTFDVTRQLKSNVNTLGVILGNGRFYGQLSWVHTFGYPKLLLQLDIEYSDGTRQLVISDDKWRITDRGPIIANNEFVGEEYDARLEMDGWATAHFNDKAWEDARLVDAPGGILQAQMIEPIRVTQVLKPVSITCLKPGVQIVDFGQSFYGSARLKTKGPAGTEVRMRMAYALRPDGSLKTEDNRTARATDVYTLRGRGEETWAPRFKGQGFRRISLSGFPGTPTANDLEGLVTHTDMKPVGKFACSNALINRIHGNIRWGQRMYIRSMPLDPDRDERQGWLGDPAKNVESIAYNFNAAAIYTKWLGDIRFDQRDDGSLSDVSPALYAYYSGDIVWPSVITIMPEWAYNFYGDRRIVEENYACAKKWMTAMTRAYVCTYGDWCDVASARNQAEERGTTSPAIIGAAYYYHNCRLMARMAHLLGKNDDERYFADLAASRAAAFHRQFFNPKDYLCESKTQCAAVLSLNFGLVPEEHQTGVVKWLVDDILDANHGHLTVGLVGMQWYMQTLTGIGRPDVAYTVAGQTSFPSWGYMIAKDATTIWERWDYDQRDSEMNSEALLMLAGNLNAWFYQTLAGINYDREGPGFKKAIIKPAIVGDLTWVKAHYDSIHGRIVSNWKHKNGKLTMEVTIPANTTAKVYVPTKDAASVTESAKPIAQAEGVKFLRTENNYAVYQIGSGTYQFESSL
jgi:alpha-L-rhamnosidase